MIKKMIPLYMFGSKEGKGKKKRKKKKERRKFLPLIFLVCKRR